MNIKYGAVIFGGFLCGVMNAFTGSFSLAIAFIVALVLIWILYVMENGILIRDDIIASLQNIHKQHDELEVLLRQEIAILRESLKLQRGLK